jgi:eukaryotic-like serine/threonine-protein kinase
VRIESGHTPVQQQFGRYHIKREIGHGGQGVVYEAYDPIVDRQVALKVLQASLENAEQMRTLMEHEARVTGRLAHPHIIRVYDFGIQEGQPYLTMQYVDGPSLDGMLASRTPLPLFFTLHVIQQAAEALAFAHKSGVIHLDVKPGNILIGQPAQTLNPLNSASLGKFLFPHVFLSDFTMAAIRRDIKQTIRLPSPIGSAHLRPSVMKGVTAGTIPYAAPEQLDGGDTKRIGPPSDLFALGVVFHEMLTGQRLFAAQHLSVTQMLVQRGHVSPPSTLAAGIPREADTLCLHMLARNVDDRIASAEDVVRATAQILETLEA